MVTMRDREVVRNEQVLRELASDLADMVEAGDMTDMEANETINRVADRMALESEAKGGTR